MKRNIHPVMIMILVWILIALTAGCVRMPAGDSTPSVPETVITGDSKPIDQIRGPSGPLRLWWDLKESQNPLLATSSSSKAVYALVFGQLFKHDSNWQLQPELVQDYSYSEERLQLTLSLKADSLFHDLSPVTAMDVLATLNEIQNLGLNSPYAAGLAAYSSGRLINDSTVVLQLSKPDPAFLSALTFPVLKASEVSLPSGSTWHGTRSFRMADQSETGMRLERLSTSQSDSVSLQTILVKTYGNAVQAMRGLEDDQLDLVLLPTGDLYQYQMRSSLRLDRFASRTFIYYSFGNLIPDGPDRLRFKYFFRASRWANSRTPWPGHTSDIPVPAFHACLDGQPLDLEPEWKRFLIENSLMNPDETDVDSVDPADSIQRLPTRQDTLRLIVPAGQTLLLDMARQAMAWLSEVGIAAVVEPLPMTDFLLAKETGDFALAFETSEIPASTEPSWYFAPPLKNKVTEEEGLPETGANRYDDSLSSLKTGWPFFTYLGHGLSQPENARSQQAALYRQVLSSLVLEAPGGGILLSDAAVAYGDRVIGQCQPTLSQPYNGIEELWIWSGS